MKRVWLFLALLAAVCLLPSCDDETHVVDDEGVVRLDGFRFLAGNNSFSLISDVECSLVGDSVIECLIPHIVESKMLVPSFDVRGGRLMAGGIEVMSDETLLDCSRPLELQLVGKKCSKNYLLKVKCFTGLPVVYIDTEDKVAITSKEEYINAVIRVVEDIETRGAGDVFENPVKIKGRGNSTWTFPKKPYKIKFDEKVSLLGEPADKEWVLLANYPDKTSLRNKTAFEMGRMSSLDYTCRTHFMELVLNGEYCGTYQLGEQLKIAKHRVDVGDDGFLLEVDAKAAADDVTFRVAHINYPLNIKDPSVEVGSDAYNHVVQYLNEADAALFGADFTDQANGYAKYLDVESFVDWYLINEIAKNNDACFFSSCYMNLARGGKLKMGPLWDFDIAFGNVNYNGCDSPEGFWIKERAGWYARLFGDPAFVARVKERFAFFYESREDIYAGINADAAYLKYSVVENNNKWNTLYVHTWPNNTIWGSYENEVQSMKIWLEKRFEWLKGEFDRM